MSHKPRCLQEVLAVSLGSVHDAPSAYNDYTNVPK